MKAVALLFMALAAAPVGAVVPARPSVGASSASCPYRIQGKLMYVNLALVQQFQVTQDLNGVTYTAVFNLVSNRVTVDGLREASANALFEDVLKTASECARS